MFAYCNNNAVLFADSAGNRCVPALHNTRDGFLRESGTDFANSPGDEIAKRKKELDPSNTDEQIVLGADYFAFYKGVPVIKVPSWVSSFSETSSFSFGLILMGQEGDADLLRHEYGHTIQLQELGVWDYYKYVVKPSVSRYNKTKDGPYSWDSYYSTPWEYQADQYGGVTRNYKPWASESSERYWDRVNSLRN